MRRIFPLLIVIALAVMPAAFAESLDSLLVNGGIDAVSDAGFPTGWYRDMWFTDPAVSSLTVEADGVGGNTLCVTNLEINDARWAQDVAVEPGTLYRLSAMVRADGLGEDGYGANLSVRDTFSYSDMLYDTGGDWIELSLVGRTGPEQTMLTVCARIGGYGDDNLNTGRAFFDDLSLVRLDAEPAGEPVFSFAGFSRDKSETVDPVDKDAAPARHTEALLLFLFAYVLCVIGFARKFRGGSNRRPAWLFLAVLALALVVRLAIASKVRGYNTDIGCFSAWSERMASVGPLNFYADDYFCDYPPGYMLLLGPVALLRSMFGIAYNSAAHTAFLKLIPIACELLGAVIVYRFAQKRLGERAAVLLAGFYALNPAVIIDSAAWGQIDSVLTLAIVVCALELVKGRYLAALPAFAVAVLIKPQALLFAPLGLAAVVVRVAVSKSARRDAVLAAGGAGLALLLMYLVALPFSLANGAGFSLLQPARWLWNLYANTFQGYRYLTVNTFNLYAILGGNWLALSKIGGWAALPWALFVLSYIYSIALLAVSRDAGKVFLTGGLLIVLITAFGPMMHERYVFPALILLALAYAECRDRRILYSLLALTATLFLNQALVLQGGMTEANYGHLQSSEEWLNTTFSIVAVLNALWLGYVALDICALRRTKSLPDPLSRPDPEPDGGYRLNLKRLDCILMAAVTVVYSIVAFVNLGATKAPQTSWVSESGGQSITIDLGEEREFIFAYYVAYYGANADVTFHLSLSDDGENWVESGQKTYDQGEIFRWEWLDENGSTVRARYARLTADDPGLVLSEVGFMNADGEPYPIASVSGDGNPSLLADEQGVVPARPSYFNSTYFDEIYHARTAYEHLHGLRTYEWTHPPLGKVLMMFGIEMFGMTPFGWRFMGALVGVLMLPVLYLIVKQLTKRTDLSFIAMFLFAVDSMHFTQTRIATIDSYAVFFILIMYFFMFRFSRMRWKRDGFWRSLVPLGLSGLFMGIAWATKWIGIYASVGLAVIFFWAIWNNMREDRAPLRGIWCFATAWAGLLTILGALGSVVLDQSGMLALSTSKLAAIMIFAARWWVPLLAVGVALTAVGIALLSLREESRLFFRLAIVSAFSVLMFIIVPLLTYYFSYYWHMRAEGGLTVARVVNLQKSIFGYHAGLHDTHYFRSEWYQWPVIAWPMWFYSGTQFMPEGVISSISCMGNPAVWWFGLAAMLFVAFAAAWRRRAPRAYVLVLIAFLSQYLPWVVVPRSTFIYHYFASVPFIIVAAALLLDRIRAKNRLAFRVSAGVLAAVALLLFIAFYPLESGVPVARGYAMLLRWFNWYNF
ncbi:MAG: phospholipid carrier-dependent glycosyltransferase [Clostridiales bacterium]|nr:phospholipid carrier-dependent glycosyltransferase [Clostridiales bacterium]